MAISYIDPPGWGDLSHEDILAHSNGCGPQGTFDFVPDSPAGVDCDPACTRHDIMYWQGGTESDRFWADVILLLNMIIACAIQSPRKLVLLIPVAVTYFTAVRVGGRACFNYRDGAA